MDNDRQQSDMQFRMNKKIAQLTKVIYQLNSRCEDSDAMMRAVANEYENEVAQVMADARSKIVTLRDEIAAKKDDAKLQKIVQTMSSQHEAARQQAMRQFEEFKTEAAKAEAATRRAAEERIAAMTTEVNQLKALFDQRVRDIEAAASSSQGELADVLKRKNEEINRLVVEYNDKFKAMLAEQMSEQDKLEARLKQEHATHIADLQSAHDKELAGAARKEAVQRERAERAEQALKEEQERSKGLETLVKQKETENAQLELQRSLLDERVRAMTADLTSQAKDGQNLNATLQALREKIRVLEASSIEKDQQLHAVSEQLSKKQSLVTALENEISVLKASVAAGNSALDAERQRTTELTGALEKSKAEVVELTARLEALARDVEASRGTASRSQTEAAAALSALRDQSAAKQRELEARISEMVRQHEIALAELRQSLTSNMHGSLGNLQEQHRLELEQLRSTLEEKHRLALDAQARDGEAAAKRVEAKHGEAVTALRAESQAQKEAFEKQIRALQAQLEAAARDHDALVQSSANEQSRLQAEVANLRDQLRTLGGQSADTVAALQDEQRRREEEASKVAAAHRQERDDLAKKIAALEKELDVSKKAINDLVSRLSAAESEAKSLAAQHATQVQAQQLEFERQLRELQERNTSGASAVASQYANEIATLKKQHGDACAAYEKRIAELQRNIADMQSGTSSQLEQLSSRIAELEAEAAREAERFAQREQSLRAGAADAARDSNSAQAALRQKIAELEAKMVTENNARKAEMSAALADHAAATDAMRTQHAGELDLLRREAQTALENAIATKEQERERALSELNGRLSRAMQSAEEAAHLRYEELNAAREALDREFGLLKQSKAKSDGQVEALRRELADTKSEFSAAKRQHEAALHVAEENARAEAIAADERKKLALQALRNEHAEHVHSLNQLFDSNKEEWAAKQKQFKSAIADLEYRIANRESRKEDVEKINELLRSNKEKDAALLKAYQDMKQHKLELMLKDKTYNQVFGRQPTLSAADQAAMATVAQTVAGAPAVPPHASGPHSAPSSAATQSAAPAAPVRTKSMHASTHRS